MSDLANPNIDQTTLAQLAQFRPDLWSGVLNHPNCYPDLATWIRQRSAARPTFAPTTSSITTGFSASASPLSTGFSTSADPVPTRFATPTTAPAQPGYPAQSGFPAPTPLRAGVKLAWQPIAMGIAAVVSILTLLMPIATITAYGTSITVGWFAEQTIQAGLIGLGVLLIVVVVSMRALFMAKRWTWITAGVVSALLGIGGMISIFALIAGLSSEASRLGVSLQIGGGVFLLGLLTIVITVIAVLIIIRGSRLEAQPQY